MLFLARNNSVQHLQVLFINFIWDAQITTTPNWYNVSAGEYDNCRVDVSAQCVDAKYPMNIFVKLKHKFWIDKNLPNSSNIYLMHCIKCIPKFWIFLLILSFSWKPRGAFTIMNILELLVNFIHHLLSELAIFRIRKSSDVSQLFWRELCWMKCSWQTRNIHLS